MGFSVKCQFFHFYCCNMLYVEHAGRSHSAPLRSQKWPRAGRGDVAGPRSSHSIQNESNDSSHTDVVMRTDKYSHYVTYISIASLCSLYCPLLMWTPFCTLWIIEMFTVMSTVCVCCPERTVPAAHGHTGRSPELCTASAASWRTCRWCHQRLPDGAARSSPLWTLQSGKGHRGQEGKP